MFKLVVLVKLYMLKENILVLGLYFDFFGFCSGENFVVFFRMLVKFEKYLL